MMLLPVLFMLLASLRPPLAIADDDVRVIENFLSLEESDDLLAQTLKQIYQQPLDSRVRSTVKLDKGIHTRLVESMTETVCLAADSCDQLSSKYYSSDRDYEIVPATTITKPTSRHRDQPVDPTAQLANREEFKTGFVFLDDNPAAHFHYGNSTTIEAKKGALVIFDNHVLHHTTFVSPVTDSVPKPDPLYLLGPFTVTSNFALTLVGVGATTRCDLPALLTLTTAQAGDYLDPNILNIDGTPCALQIEASKKNNRRKCRFLQRKCRKNVPYFGSSRRSARLLNSSNPKYDLDLGTPNQNCTPPGVGVGAAGASGMPYDNCAARGNVLIIQQSGYDEPNSWSYGGTITFNFTANPAGVNLISIGILGLDAGAKATLMPIRSGGYADQSIILDGGGKNSFMDVSLTGSTYVLKLSVTATSSFAITHLVYDVDGM